jgi:hypothetical protein
MPQPVCAFCGKGASRASLEVRDGDKRFHLDLRALQAPASSDSGSPPKIELRQWSLLAPPASGQSN